MFQEFFARSDNLVWPLIGLLMFAALFVGVLAYVFFGLRDRSKIDDIAALPADEDPDEARQREHDDILALVISQRAGRFDEAVESWKKAFELDPRHEAAVKARETIAKAKDKSSNLIVAYAYGTEFFIAWYSHNSVEMETFRWRAVGDYSVQFWIMVTCNAFVTLLFFYLTGVAIIFGAEVNATLNFGLPPLEEET